MKLLSARLAATFVAFATCAAAAAQDPAPLSDPENSGGWVLNPQFSDEFDDGELDAEKWIVQGDGGVYYTWEGRAPSQFAPHNVFEKNGKLVLRSQWEPDFDFLDKEYNGAQYGDPKAPVTAAAVISKHRFLYGYLEARTKASNSNMTSSFWTLGYQSELDMYEQMGNPKRQGNIEADTLNSAIHDWRPGRYGPEFGSNKVFNNKHELGFRVADDFHVYGTEWDPDYLRFFVDGELIHEVSREEIGEGWVLTNPLELWFDTEIFEWLGMPHPEELPADYEIDYVRVWQKPTPELLATHFFGFEGPMIYSENERRRTDGRRGAEPFQRQWYFHGKAADHLEIVEYENYFRGKQSLRYTQTAGMADGSLTAFAPFESVDTSAGEYMMSLRIYVPQDAGSATVQLVLEDPWLQLPAFDLATLPRDEWVRVQFPISRRAASSEKDRLRIVISPGEAAGTYYFDSISLQPSD